MTTVHEVLTVPSNSKKSHKIQKYIQNIQDITDRAEIINDDQIQEIDYKSDFIDQQMKDLVEENNHHNHLDFIL